MHFKFVEKLKFEKEKHINVYKTEIDYFYTIKKRINAIISNKLV